jgi:hypothetical protein
MVGGNTSGVDVDLELPQGVDNSKDNRLPEDAAQERPEGGRRLREEKTATLQEPQEAAPPKLAPAPPSHSTVGDNALTLLP